MSRSAAQSGTGRTSNFSGRVASSGQRKEAPWAGDDGAPVAGGFADYERLQEPVGGDVGRELLDSVPGSGLADVVAAGGQSVRFRCAGRTAARRKEGRTPELDWEYPGGGYEGSDR